MRVIPILLLRNKGMVKTVGFKNSTYLGDPINAVRIFNEKEVDEIVICDIDASRYNREPNYSWVKEIVSECFMPIAYGGGLNNLEQIKQIFDLGVEKIVLNTAAFNLGLVEKAANIYGNQSIVASIDVKKSIFGRYVPYSKSGSVKHNIPIDVLARCLVDSGVGEIIIQSIDKEGSMLGFDLELIKIIANIVNVPIVASGGAGSMSHFLEVRNLGMDISVAAGSFFVFHGKQKGILISYPEQVEINALN
jgi:cyclase